MGSAARGDVAADALLGERGLSGREPREGHAVGRARHVVEAEPVAEMNRRGIAAVLAADPELEVLPGRAATLDRDSHQVADARLVERLERIALEHAVLEVVRQE